MTFKEDITHRIKIDFGKDADQVFEILKSTIEKTDYLNSDRVIRCIIFLAKGNMNDLNKYIKAATVDTRDVMLWAEYEGVDDLENYKRLRDFNEPFKEDLNITNN